MWGEMQLSGSNQQDPYRQARAPLPHRLRLFAGTANPVSQLRTRTPVKNHLCNFMLLQSFQLCLVLPSGLGHVDLSCSSPVCICMGTIYIRSNMTLISILTDIISHCKRGSFNVPQGGW